MPIVTYNYIPASQSIGVFYICVMKATHLLQSVDILRRGMTEKERQNVQRDLSPKRQGEIARYFTDPDATFPTSIIISAYPDILEVDETERTLRFDDNHK